MQSIGDRRHTAARRAHIDAHVEGGELRREAGAHPGVLHRLRQAEPLPGLRLEQPLQQVLAQRRHLFVGAIYSLSSEGTSQKSPQVSRHPQA